MKERPVLFNDEMVRPILDGRKTQTRRPVKPQPGDGIDRLHGGKLRKRAPYELLSYDGAYVGDGFQDDEDSLWKSPFGKLGDRLWVRECWQLKNWTDAECSKAGCPDAAKHPGNELEDHYRMMYGSPTSAIYRASYNATIGSPGPWKPSIHMPRWASRINLEVVDVRVERIQDITEAEAKAEGFLRREHFIRAWDAIYKAKGFGWDANPWDWACTFRKV